MRKGARIGQGRTAEVFAWGEDRILKLYHARMPAHAIQQEYQLTRAAAAAGVPVPAANDLIEVDGRMGITFERLAGPTMLQVIADQPWKLIASARLLAELHARVHQSLAAVDLPTQRRQIEDGFMGAADLPEAVKTAARTRLAELPEGSALCHGDFHPENILITTRGPIIIDWMTAARGNPLADVCRTCVIIQTSGLPPGLPASLRLLFNITRRWIVSIYLDRYRQIWPAERSQIAAWRLPLLAARLREVGNYPAEKKLIMAGIEAAMAAR